MEYSNQHVSDAVPIDITEDFNPQGHSELFQKIHNTLDKLCPEDRKKIYFLIFDKFAGTDVDIVLNPELNSIHKFLEHLSSIDSDVKEKLFVELLYTAKIYNFLKYFGMCKHKAKIAFENENSRLISKSCRDFFDICEELQDSEVIKLCTLFNCMERSEMCAEDLFIILIQRYQTVEEVLDVLEIAFEQIKREDLKERVKSMKKQKSADNYYNVRTPTKENPCGLAVIFNQKNFDHNGLGPKLEFRERTDHDKKRLKELWVKFGFRVKDFDDLTSCEMMDEIKRLCDKENSNYDVYVICILSHGIKGAVYGRDSKPVYIENIQKVLAFNGCFIGDKPKLLFIQACQGNKELGGNHAELSVVETDQTTAEENDVSTKPLSPIYTNILIAVSTIPEYVSYRSRIDGSWFINSLVDALNEYGNQKDICFIMTIVNNKIFNKGTLYKGHKQTSIWTSTLCKTLQLKKLA